NRSSNSGSGRSLSGSVVDRANRRASWLSGEGDTAASAASGRASPLVRDGRSPGTRVFGGDRSCRDSCGGVRARPRPDTLVTVPARAVPPRTGGATMAELSLGECKWRMVRRVLRAKRFRFEDCRNGTRRDDRDFEWLLENGFFTAVGDGWHEM